MSRIDEIMNRIDARMNAIETRIETELGSSARQPREVARDAMESVRGLSARDSVRRAAVCVGLLNVDPAAYQGKPQPCPGCDLDASDFANVMVAAGFETALMIDRDATRAGVLEAMGRAAAELAAGDLFVMQISGHGARGTIDGKTHETWCLWDGMLLDDEIVEAVRRFRPGVRIVMINDQCHSGGIFSESSREVTFSVSFRDAFGERSDVPMLIQFAACRAEQSSVGYAIGGTWMVALMKVLAVDRNISWSEWFARAKDHPSLSAGQQPQWEEFGPVSDEFRNGLVFE